MPFRCRFVPCCRPTEVVVAVGCESGQVQLFDVRKMSAFLTLQDPIVGNIKQVRMAKIPLLFAIIGGT